MLLFFYRNLWIVQSRRCRSNFKIGFYRFIYFRKNYMILCRIYVLKLRLWINWCCVYNFHIVIGRNIKYGHCFQRGWFHWHILPQILWGFPLPFVPQCWWLPQISWCWSVSWWIRWQGVVIIIIVGGDLVISRERSPMIRRVFLSALEESGVSLTGSKQEQSVRTNRYGEGYKFYFRLLTVMK